MGQLKLVNLLQFTGFREFFQNAIFHSINMLFLQQRFLFFYTPFRGFLKN